MSCDGDYFNKHFAKEGYLGNESAILARAVMSQEGYTFSEVIRKSLEKTAEATTDIPIVLTAAYLEKLITYATVRIEGTGYENS